MFNDELFDNFLCRCRGPRARSSNVADDYSFSSIYSESKYYTPTYDHELFKIKIKKSFTFYFHGILSFDRCKYCLVQNIRVTAYTAAATAVYNNVVVHISLRVARVMVFRRPSSSAAIAAAAAVKRRFPSGSRWSSAKPVYRGGPN